MNPNGLQEFLEQSPLFKNKLIVLEKTENSELIDLLKPCNREFFEKVFSPNGPYWNTYNELGFGEKPYKTKHLAIVNGRMYFCRNTEKKFMFTVGPKKNYLYKNSVLKEQYNLSLDNLLLLISIPFDFAKQIASIALAQIRINEKLKEFEEFAKKSKAFQKKNYNNITDYKKLSSDCLNGAIEAMKYSFYSSMAYSLKIKLRNSSAWKECELEELSKSSSEDSRKKFGFYSKNPYDVSKPRFSEKPSEAKEFRNAKVPKNSAARWRENSKFLCARYLGILRKCYLAFGKANGLGEKVFFLKPSELSGFKKDLLKIAEKREKLFLESIRVELPKSIVYDRKWNIKYERTKSVVSETKKIKIKGIPAGGQGVVEGEIVFVNVEADYKKDLNGKIAVSKTLSPNLVLLFDRVSAIVSEGGGRVAHTAVVSIEQGMPCVVQVKNLDFLREGDKIKVNGSNGQIEKL